MYLDRDFFLVGIASGAESGDGVGGGPGGIYDRAAVLIGSTEIPRRNSHGLGVFHLVADAGDSAGGNVGRADIDINDVHARGSGADRQFLRYLFAVGRLRGEGVGGAAGRLDFDAARKRGRNLLLGRRKPDGLRVFHAVAEQRFFTARNLRCRRVELRDAYRRAGRGRVRG